MKLLTVLALIACLLSPTPGAKAQMGCGLMPLKPLVPLGCRDLTAVCTCDSTGLNCHWEWQCVR